MGADAAEPAVANSQYRTGINKFGLQLRSNDSVYFQDI
tara:strand:+ start:150 stop:263 length:114 start_codon:yes stop_codon:yes gene_type:complete